ncbi:GlcNAc-transferase family protein [Trinickia mobilis]|uniref:GlcNAc-transferase family protein n=1 Tax=Trinickia mobilis TaxID=2816356 RepID=UPI001A8DCB16|nr:GlcNAc-transferase family protein [Trinickia mobilis]
MEDTIFVQMASYRDSQLVPTLVDLIRQSTRPELLRIVVCWQHAQQETLAEFWRRGFGAWHCKTVGDWQIHSMRYGEAKLELIDVPHLKTQGACWARNLIQQHYRGERYMLQLDSHHRFVPEWDRQLIEMLNSLRPVSQRPVLTTYLPPFDPENDPDARKAYPTIMRFSRFSPEGAVFFRTAPLDEWETCERPIPARFYSAHFAFAEGHFAEVVPHDPFLFFHGEEISIAARAFTHGYDLYHPHRLIAWHEYQRKYRPKMWNDHTPQAKESGDISEDWVERNDRSHRRNRALFGMSHDVEPGVELGKYGLGSERTLTQYERYAGISFEHRGVQQRTLDRVPPVLNAPIADSEAAWKASLLRSNDIRVCVYLPALDQSAIEPSELGVLESASSGVATLYDQNDTALHTKSLDSGALAEHAKDSWLDFNVVFEGELEKIPARLTVDLFDDAGHLLARVKQTIET